MPQIEKVIPAGTNKFGRLSDNCPVVVSFMNPDEANILIKKTITVVTMFENWRIPIFS
jgi:hypothetical protein